MRRLQLILISVFIVSALPVWAFDSSEYRQNTYGPPNHYCDPARSLSSNGAGTLGDPWNLMQCQTQPVAGDVVGLLPGVGTLQATNDDQLIAFQPRRSGTSSSRIIYVTKYAAVALANVATNANRTEIRHNGLPETNQQGSGTGGPLYGSNGQSYITYDGLFSDMAQARIHEDSGLIRVENATGIHVRNFVVKGTAEQVWSNPVIYRPQGARDTVLSNFRAYDFTNSSSFGQPSLFCDSYGDENFVIEHFEISNVGKGIFMKGPHPTTPPYQYINYGIIRYGIIKNGIGGLRFGTVHPSHFVDVQYVLSYGHSDYGLMFSNEIAGYRQNIRLNHVTIIGGPAAGNQYGGIYIKPDTGMGNRIENSIIDAPIQNNIFTEETSYSEFTSDYNGFARPSTPQFYFNGTITSLSSWRSNTSNDSHSFYSNTASNDIFINRAGGDYRVALGHAALTADSRGGEIGAYAGSEIVGVDISGSGSGSGSGDITPPVAPTGIRIQ